MVAKEIEHKVHLVIGGDNRDMPEGIKSALL